MIKTGLLTAFAFIAINKCIAQNDTIIKYYGKTGQEAAKDSAVTYAKFYRQANLWHGLEYDVKKNVLKSEGDYNETNLATAVGGVNSYKDGKLDYTVEYADGKPLNKTYYYKSGNKKSYTVYDDKGIQLQKGWDDSGKELKNFIVERDAQFKGGEDGWKNYLQKNLNATIPAAVGAPAGNYDVKVQFVVDKDGIPTLIKALSVPLKCKACGAEALRILRESPKWDPAILNNEPVTFDVIKTISFQGVEGVKKG